MSDEASTVVDTILKQLTLAGKLANRLTCRRRLLDARASMRLSTQAPFCGEAAIVRDIYMLSLSPIVKPILAIITQNISSA
jgi:hypothetical protein